MDKANNLLDEFFEACMIVSVSVVFIILLPAFILVSPIVIWRRYQRRKNDPNT